MRRKKCFAWPRMLFARIIGRRSRVGSEKEWEGSAEGATRRAQFGARSAEICRTVPGEAQSALTGDNSEWLRLNAIEKQIQYRRAGKDQREGGEETCREGQKQPGL